MRNSSGTGHQDDAAADAVVELVERRSLCGLETTSGHPREAWVSKRLPAFSRLERTAMVLRLQVDLASALLTP